MISVIAFLGNPGKQYEHTRHNLGWMVCSSMTAGMDLVWTEKFHSHWATMYRKGRKIILQKPLAWMNDSGKSVQSLLSFLKIPPEELLVVHDDLELPFGALNLKEGGGTAGHKGLKSIQGALGRGSFQRLRLGIGRPRSISVSSHVLSRFTPEEEAELPALCQRAGEMIIKMLDQKTGC